MENVFGIIDWVFTIFAVIFGIGLLIGAFPFVIGLSVFFFLLLYGVDDALEVIIRLPFAAFLSWLIFMPLFNFWNSRINADRGTPV